MQSYGAKSIYGSDIPREGELLALIPEDILPSMQLNICKTFAVVDVEQVTLTPKTNRSKRIVTIPEFLYNEIEEHISKLYEIKKNDRIFMFTKSSLIGEIKTLAAKAGVKQIRVHDLRHSHASMLINMGFWKSREDLDTNQQKPQWIPTDICIRTKM